MNISKLKKELIISEGLRLKAYKDSVGKVTIGVGRNLDDLGISEKEALFLLNNDITRVHEELLNIVEYSKLCDPRQRVIAEMVFNLGLKGVMKFQHMWQAIKCNNWDTAANEMLNSLWAKQVGIRAQRLATRMRIGKD